MKTAGRLSTEEKVGRLRRIEVGERLADVARDAAVLRKSLYEWRAADRAIGAAGLDRKRGPKPGGRAAVDPSSADAGPPAALPPDALAKAKARIVGGYGDSALNLGYGDSASNSIRRVARLHIDAMVKFNALSS